MKIEELKQLYEMAEKLGDGKEPATNLSFPEDTILNSEKIKNYNKQVAKILSELILTAEKNKGIVELRNQKLGFCLSEEKKASVHFSKTPISISSFVYLLNGMIDSYMKKLHAEDITKWLLSHGYLEQREMDNGNMYKVATPRGSEIGIINEKRQNRYGNMYSVNLYNEDAQRFVVNHLNDILYKEC